MRTRLTLAALALGLASASGAAPAQAQTAGASVRSVASPEGAMAAALAAEDVNQLPKTARLTALEHTYNARRVDHDPGDGDLGFEYLTGAQEPAEVENVTSRARTSGATMTLITRFRVFGNRTRTLTSRWLRGRDGWRMDDITDGTKSLADYYRALPE